MNELYELKDKLVEELENLNRKELTNSNLDMIDKLAHAAKNICKIIESDDGEYSQRYSRYYPMDRGMSYARKRDSMGRYSRHGDFREQLEEMIRDAPDDNVRQQMQNILNQMR